jgi:capsular exopolysaccharide synthesis family protein
MTSARDRTGGFRSSHRGVRTVGSPPDAPQAEEPRRSYSLRPRPGLVMLDEDSVPTAESFRRLAAKLASERQTSRQVLMVTSALPEEGKTFVSLNLSLALAMKAGTRVLLVDADFRGSGLRGWLEPRPQVGFGDALLGQPIAPGRLVRQGDLELELDILPASGLTGNPVDHLASSQCEAVLAALRSRYDRIVIDTPPMVPFADAATLADHVDGALVVTRSGVTPKGLYREIVEELAASVPIVGSVLNGAERNLIDRRERYGAGYYGYYARRGQDED